MRSATRSRPRSPPSDRRRRRRHERLHRTLASRLRSDRSVHEASRRRADRRRAAVRGRGSLWSAEVRLGPRRITELATMTAGVTVLSVDAETIEQVAQLRNAWRRAGHALHQAIHNADLWIAAAAIRWAPRSSRTMPCSSAVLVSICGRNSCADSPRRGGGSAAWRGRKRPASAARRPGGGEE